MCHRIIAEKVCEDCGCKMGEAVIAFDACSRKCTTPSYRLSPEPLELVCNYCMAARTPESESSASGEERDHSIFPRPFVRKGQGRRKRQGDIVIEVSQVN